MVIRTLKVSNFGCLKELSLGFPRPLTVLVGPNDSGKSMILRAIEWLGTASQSQHGWRECFANRKDFDAATFGGKGGEIGFEIWGVLQKTEYQYRVQLSTPLDHVTVDQELVSFSNVFTATRENGVLRISRKGTSQALGPFSPPSHLPLLNIDYLRSFSHVFDSAKISKTGLSECQSLLTILKSIRRYSFVPARLRAHNEHDRQPILDSDGYGLARTCAQLLLQHREQMQQIEEALRKSIPQVRRVNVFEKERYYDLDIETASGARVPAPFISDGVLLVLGYLILTMGAEPSPLLLLEEPENGIHPGLLARLMEFLRGLSQGSFGPPAQVIMTTHSPVLLNFVNPAEILIVQRDADGATGVSAFSNAQDLNALLEFQGPGEIWLNVGESQLIKST